MVATERIGQDPAGLAVGAACDLTEPPVEEDPVVELAAPAMQVGIADEPRDLWECLAERRAIDRDPASSRASTLDDLDPVILRGRAVARRQGRREGLDVHRVVGHGRRRDRCPARTRRRHPGAIADTCRPVLPELPVRGHVGQPAEVVPDADPGKIGRAERSKVDRGVEMEREACARPGRQGRIAGRWLTGRRSSARTGTMRAAYRAGRHRSRRPRWRTGSPTSAVVTSAMPTPVSNRRRRTAVPPSRRRAIPNPLNRLVASSASSHG